MLRKLIRINFWGKLLISLNSKSLPKAKVGLEKKRKNLVFIYHSSTHENEMSSYLANLT